MQNPEAYIRRHFAEMLDDLRALAVIAAPSGHEDARAQWVLEYLRRYGANPVVDDAKNVLLTFGAPSPTNPCDAYIAHTDVVFPDLTPLPLVEDGSVFRAPGIGDDTANLVCLLLTARYLLENHCAPARPVLLAANACEEGLGNLRGVTRICEDYPVGRLVTFDGGIGSCVTTAVGSYRYRVTVYTEGGHSFGAFGNRNAIAYLSSMIDTLYRMKAPEYGKTTYNVGQIGGGTSVNTIAEEAWMLYEFRSDDRRGLDAMKTFFERVLDAYRAMGIAVDCELLGVRPCNGDVNPDAMRALIDLADGVSFELTGEHLRRTSGSTDANLPLSRGIPAVCLGVVGRGGGTHTRDEWIDTADLERGALYCMKIVLSSFTQ